MKDRIAFEDIGWDSDSGQEQGAGLWIVPCNDLKEKQFVVCLRGNNPEGVAEANPGFLYSDALGGYYRYLSIGQTGKEIVVSFQLPASSRITVSLERWKMSKDLPLEKFIASVYLIRNFEGIRVLEKA